jgi:hypothetical protein
MALRREDGRIYGLINKDHFICGIQGRFSTPIGMMFLWHNLQRRLSLVYHNVVPTVCAQLEGDRNKITKAVVVGSLIPFLMSACLCFG